MLQSLLGRMKRFARRHAEIAAVSERQSALAVELAELRKSVRSQADRSDKLRDDLLAAGQRLQGEIAMPPSRTAELTQDVADLRRAVQTAHAEIEGLKQAIAGLRETQPGLWRKYNLLELTVAIVLQDLCRPGAVVWDCGANVGGLSVLMSRLVGPRGVVCAFEASPRVIDECLRNVVMNGCGNTTLYHAAVYHTSGQTVPIYYGQHTMSDSIVAGKDTERTGECVRVPTLALDDFVRRTGLAPDVVKMDIEGAEYDALVGMRETIGSARPHLILETDTSDDRCLKMLRSWGYTAIDVGNYREVRTGADYPDRSVLRNLLYIHESRLDEAGYRPPFELTECGRFVLADFDRSADGSLRQTTPIELPAGRYVVEVDATAEGQDNQVVGGVRVRDAIVQMYWCSTAHLLQSYRDWVFCLPEPSPAELFFEFRGGTFDPTFVFRGAVVRRLTRFDTRPHPRVV